MKKLDFPFKLITTEQQLIDYCSTIDLDKLLIHDVETTDLRPENCFITGHGLYQHGGDAVFIVQDFPGVWKGIPKEIVKKHIEPILTSCPIGGHNYKYDWLCCAFEGYSRKVNLVEDSMIAAHLYDTDQRLNLELRIREDLGIDKKSYDQIIGKKFDKIVWEIDTKPQYNKKTKKKEDAIVTQFNLGYYCAEDVVATYYLIEHYKDLIHKEQLQNIYYQVELPLTEVLVDMYYGGVHVDVSELKRQEKLLTDQLEKITQDIYLEAGYEFNVNSPAQKIDILYNKMGLPIYGTTKTGAPSTDKDALKKLAKDGHEIARLLLYYNKRSKILSTYIIAMQKIQQSGIIRANFNQSGTTTLRFSSSSPNLQNLSNDKDEEDFAVRRCFLPSPGNYLICTDYSAQEYCIAAHASGDKAMKQIFVNKEDLHQRVAEMAGVDRKQAKTVGFGIFYGLSIENLAEMLGMDEDEAFKLMDDYFSMFPSVKQWMEAVKDFVRKNKYIRTPVGSIRRFPNFNRDRNGAYRQAINACIQGSAAIQMKMAMVKFFRQLSKRPYLRARIVLTVHDELIIDCPANEVEEVCRIVQHSMETAVRFFKVPFQAVPNVVSHYGQGKDDKYNLRQKVISLDYIFLSNVLNIGKLR